MKDKLFFFGYYEGFRQTTQTSQNLTVPANADFFDGVFRYAGTDGVVRSVERACSCRGRRWTRSCGSDFFAQIPGAANVNNFDVGNSTRGPRPEHRRVPVQPDRPQQPRPVRVPHRLRAHGQAPVRRRLQLLQGDRRPHRSRLHQPPIARWSTPNSDPKRFVGWRGAGSPARTSRTSCAAAPTSRPSQFESDWVSAAGTSTTTALGIVNPIGGNGAGHRLPAAGPLHEHLPAQRQRVADARQPRSCRWAAAGSRNHVNPYNFAGAFPQVNFGLQPGRADESSQLDDGAAPRWHHRR